MAEHVFNVIFSFLEESLELSRVEINLKQENVIVEGKGRMKTNNVDKILEELPPMKMEIRFTDNTSILSLVIDNNDVVDSKCELNGSPHPFEDKVDISFRYECGEGFQEHLLAAKACFKERNIHFVAQINDKTLVDEEDSEESQEYLEYCDIIARSVASVFQYGSDSFRERCLELTANEQNMSMEKIIKYKLMNLPNNQ